MANVLVMVKTLKNIIIVLAVLSLGACASPYASIKGLKSMDDLQYPFEVHKQLMSSGAEVAYVDEGAGSQTIILVHGLGSYIPAWKRNIPELSKNFRVIALDLPGYGKSSKGPWEGSLKFFSNTVMELADSLGIETFVMGGHSMGGQITLLAALEHPTRVSKLILVSPAGFETFHDGEKDWFRSVATPSLTLYAKPKAIQENLGINFYDFPEEADFMIRDRIAIRTAVDFDGYAHIVAQSIKAMVDRPVFDYLDQVKQPTLILFGESDLLIPNRFLTGGKTIVIAEQGHAKMPNSTLFMVPEAGHFMHFEKPEFFNIKVKEFLQ
jgi:pimeloyl-ACP methyl ester carboxylesterase